MAPAGSVPNMGIDSGADSTSVTMIPQMDSTLLEVWPWACTFQSQMG